MLKMSLKGLLSPLWICVLSFSLANPALGKIRCDRGKMRNPKVCKSMKRDARGCCKKLKRKKRKSLSKRSNKSSSWFSPRHRNKSSSWISGWLPWSEFHGVGLKSDYYSSSQGSDRSLGIAARTGTFGLISKGLVGSVNYRFNSRIISGHAGLDAYFLLFGLQLGMAWQVDQLKNHNDFGINYGLKFVLPSSYPMFITLGAQVYTEAPSEFFINFSIFTSINS